MRWPTRALVLVGLRFEDADAERRFAHSLRTKQLISFIILQFAYVVIAFAVAARLPSEADTPFMVIIAFLFNLICTAALAYARKLGPELRRFWIPDALLAATAVLAPLEQYRMVSYWCRADGMVCDQTYIAQNTHELTVTALLLVLSTPTRIVYLLPHAILLPSVIIADPDAAFLPHSSLQKSVPLLLLVVAWAMGCARERLQRQQWHLTQKLEAALAKQAVLERVIVELKTPSEGSFMGDWAEGSFDYVALLADCGGFEYAAQQILRAFDPQPPLDAIEEVMGPVEIDGAGAATIYVEAHKLKALCKSVCAAEAQAAALHLEQAAKECAPKYFRGATATVLAPADSDELRAAFESLQLAMLPLRNDVAARLGTRDSA